MPLAASSRTMARPMPRLPPVTTATCSVPDIMRLLCVRVHLPYRDRGSTLRPLHLLLALGAKRELGVRHALPIDRRISFDYTTDRNRFDKGDLNLQLITWDNRFQKADFGPPEEEQGLVIVKHSPGRFSTLTEENERGLRHTLDDERPGHDRH